MENGPNDPLHGITLKMILEQLVEHFGWETMGKAIDIRCFTNDPSIASSLKFLRKTPWARDKVESLYLTWKMNLLEQPEVNNTTE
ncbi:MAG: VF530 family protein [Geobacteraceae bacterium]|nr:VF530 family protein [Geobacteraceae bacterium]